MKQAALIILAITLTVWLCSVLVVVPLERRVNTLERKLEMVMNWPYVTPTPLLSEDAK